MDRKGKIKEQIKEKDMYQYILFDLDGTLTDPKEGITKSARYALKGMGIEENNMEKLEPFIGPPLRESFQEFYGLEGEENQQAVTLFREYFEKEGIRENEIYPGISGLLHELKEKGFMLAIASSKPQEFVHIVLKNFGIEECFSVIVGSERDGLRDTKTEVMQEAINQLKKKSGRRYQPEKVLMVGDRKYDVEGAHSFGVDSAAVTYGYAPEGELEACAPTYLVEDAGQLREVITGEKSYLQYRDVPSFRKAFEILCPLLVYWAVQLFVFNGLYYLAVKYLEYDTTGLSRLSVYLNAAAAIATWPILSYYYKKSGMFDTSHIITRRKNRKFKREWILVVAYAISLGVGLNVLVAYLQLANLSGSFQQVAGTQYSVPLVVGLVVYGILTPFTEELLFRGVIYNRIRKYFPVSIAIVFSGVIFGCYHGNIVQMLYALVMGFVMALLYEYYGLFHVPVLFHCSANIMVYVLSKGSAFAPGQAAILYGCILLALAAGISWWYLNCYRKKCQRRSGHGN